MKQAFIGMAFLLPAAGAIAQSNVLDNYLVSPVTVTTVGGAANQVSQPTDLDFRPDSRELWVCQYGNSNGGSLVIFFDAGLPGQTSEYRKDTHNGHFMIYPPAMAFGDNGEWAAVSEVKNTSSASSTFMGPALWSGDTAITARVFQNNWLTGYPLGSHLDMPHQSPYAMGIANDSLKVYWVMDGYNGNICRYDFVMDHGPGYDNHSAGKIWRYVDVPVSRVPGVPSHMVLDKASRWLYYIDGQSKQIRRMNTATGSVTGNLTVPSTSQEPLAGYYKVEFATVEILDTLSTQPCGIDYYNNRLVVSDYTTGDIYLYNTAGSFTLMGVISTGLPGMMGVKVGPDGRIWCVNKSQNAVYRLDMVSSGTDLAVTRIDAPAVSNHQPGYFSLDFTLCDGNISPVATVLNSGSTTVTSAVLDYSLDGGSPVTFSWTGSIAPGSTQAVSFPSSPVTAGDHRIRVRINSVNGTPDDVDLNDAYAGAFRVLGPSTPVPLSEDFTASAFPPASWSYVHFNPNNKMDWLPIGGFGMSTGCLRMNHFTGPMNITGQKDFFLSPVIDMSGAQAADNWLRFSIAYAQRNSGTQDKLEVKASADCGLTWSTVYTKTGAGLATAPPKSSFFNPTATEWRTDSIDLSALAGQPEVVIQFASTSAFGNNLFIDDLFIGALATGIGTVVAPTVSLGPSPADESLYVRCPGTSWDLADILIVDLSGREVRHLERALRGGEARIDVRDLASGPYLLHLVADGQSASARFMRR